MIGFPSFNLFFLLYQKKIEKACHKQTFSEIFLILEPFLITSDIYVFNKGYANHIKRNNQEKEKEISAIQRIRLQN